VDYFRLHFQYNKPFHHHHLHYLFSIFLRLHVIIHNKLINLVQQQLLLLLAGKSLIKFIMVQCLGRSCIFNTFSYICDLRLDLICLFYLISCNIRLILSQLSHLNHWLSKTYKLIHIDIHFFLHL